jgi:hypothetical protein
MTAIKPEPGGTISGFGELYSGQAIDFIGVDGHLHRLEDSGTGWTDTDLTAVTGAPQPLPQSGLTGYWRPPVDVQVLYFAANDYNHVFQLALGTGDPNWVSTDVTSAADGLVPVAGRALSAFWDNTTHEPNVFLVGSGQHVVHLTSGNISGWIQEDLTMQAKAVLAQPNTALDAYAGTDETYHVNYIGNDGHVHELYFVPKHAWVDNDLTQLAAAVAPNPDTALDGYWGSDDSQHVNYIGNDGHVHELYIAPGRGWVDNDLTKLADAVAPNVGSALSGYWGSDNSQHVNFFGADGHVHELYIAPGGGWVDNDLTALAGAVAPIVGDRALHSYWGNGSSQHVSFVGVDGDLHQLSIQPGTGWADSDLTQIA